MHSIPEADELREMLKGKNTSQRREMLAEIERAKQAHIHLTYMMEKQSADYEERFARQNFSERQNIMALVSAANYRRPVTSNGEQAYTTYNTQTTQMS